MCIYFYRRRRIRKMPPVVDLEAHQRLPIQANQANWANLDRRQPQQQQQRPQPPLQHPPRAHIREPNLADRMADYGLELGPMTLPPYSVLPPADMPTLPVYSVETSPGSQPPPLPPLPPRSLRVGLSGSRSAAGRSAASRHANHQSSRGAQPVPRRTAADEAASEIVQQWLAGPSPSHIMRGTAVSRLLVQRRMGGGGGGANDSREDVPLPDEVLQHPGHSRGYGSDVEDLV
jgi:hypothetical protein